MVRYLLVMQNVLCRHINERPDIIAARRRYLREIRRIREEGLYSIVYTDETWLNARHTVNRVSLSVAAYRPS